MDSDFPSTADIALCASVLTRLQPSDLQLSEIKAILDAGVALFRRHILKDTFGSGDAVGFLKEKNKVNQRLKKLSQLHSIVSHVGESRRRAAELCGINQARKKELADILNESAECASGESALVPSHDCRETRLLGIADAAMEGHLEAASCKMEANLKMREVKRDQKTKDIQGFRSAAAEQCEEVVDPSLDSGSKETDEPVNHVDLEKSLPNRGDLHSYCNMCRGEFFEHHHFYHQLCPLCAELNWEKRDQTTDMTGMVCIVTGGRVRIGYQIVLKLLRAGAFVLTTTRFPSDCALRFSREADFETWRDRLEVCGPLELSDMRLVERFCDQLVLRFPRIHVLINNAAQTLTRRMGWEARMANLENTASSMLPASAQALLQRPLAVAAPETLSLTDEPSTALVRTQCDGNGEVMWLDAVQLEDFPEGALDESRQPLDLSRMNSWSRRLGEIPTLELLQTLAANTAAPFIMCSRLACRLAPANETDPYGHIINVSAMEGKFAAKFKSTGHPHTNMSKAALNMLTHTSAPELFQRRILMNCVDTGWVTDMAPCGVGSVAASRTTFVGPPLDEVDGAARVLDPIFMHLKDPSWLIRGKFYKNYYISAW